MTFEATVRDAIAAAESIGADPAKLDRVADLYEEVASRAPDELATLGKLEAEEGRRLWSRLTLGGLELSGRLMRTAAHPSIDLSDWLALGAANRRLHQATVHLMKVTTQRAKRRSTGGAK